MLRFERASVVGPDFEFLYICVAGPGKTNDVRAFARCKLRLIEKNQGYGLYVTKIAYVVIAIDPCSGRLIWHLMHVCSS